MKRSPARRIHEESANYDHLSNTKYSIGDLRNSNSDYSTSPIYVRSDNDHTLYPYHYPEMYVNPIDTFNLRERMQRQYFGIPMSPFPETNDIPNYPPAHQGPYYPTYQADIEASESVQPFQAPMASLTETNNISNYPPTYQGPHYPTYQADIEASESVQPFQAAMASLAEHDTCDDEYLPQQYFGTDENKQFTKDRAFITNKEVAATSRATEPFDDHDEQLNTDEGNIEDMPEFGRGGAASDENLPEPYPESDVNVQTAEEKEDENEETVAETNGENFSHGQISTTRNLNPIYGERESTEEHQQQVPMSEEQWDSEDSKKLLQIEENETYQQYQWLENEDKPSLSQVTEELPLEFDGFSSAE